MRRTLILCLLVVGAPLMAPAEQPSQPAAVANVFVVTLDGMRWQEVFGGMTADLLTRESGGVGDATAVEKRFGGPAEAARRERLMPFFWSTIARQGQVFGDPAIRSIARVTNGLRFSYPGYNELLAGFADPRIDSNDPKPNPNVTVLEWLNRRPGFEGRVAAFASWEILPWILNASRSGITCNGEGAAGGDGHDRPRASSQRVRRRLSSLLGVDAVRRTDRLRRARISARAVGRAFST